MWSYHELTSTKQCAIPVFELLLPSRWNEPLLDLLFELATWQGLAKLRMHTDTTLGFLDTSTTRLGRFLRHFVKETEEEFETRDLPSEEAARGRRKARQAAKQGPSQSAALTSRRGTDGPKIRRFNFETYKLHALGDYVDAIRQFGTTDNFTTQPVRSRSDFVYFGTESIYSRASLNIVASNDSIRESAKQSSHLELQNRNVVNGFYSKWLGQSTTIQNRRKASLQQSVNLVIQQQQVKTPPFTCPSKHQSLWLTQTQRHTTTSPMARGTT